MNIFAATKKPAGVGANYRLGDVEQNLLRKTVLSCTAENTG